MKAISVDKSRLKEQKIPILFIVPNLARAGAETQVLNLANLLNCGRFEKHLFTYLSKMDQYDRINRNEVTFYNHIRKNRYDINVIKTVSNIIDQKGIEVIHCTMQHSLLVGWIGRLYAKRKPKIIAAIHTTINESIKGELSDKFLYQHLLRGCNRVQFVCKNQQEYWINKYPILSKNSVVVYNGVNTEYFDPDKFLLEGQKLRKQSSIPDNAPVVCCIANFRPEKAHNILINAFACMDKKCFLLLAGDGKTKPDIVDLVHNKKLNDRVKFLGDLSDIRPVLAASNVSVISSTAVETFSMAMLESMSMGVPVVATDIGGLSEAIDTGDTGFLVPVGNPEALSNALTIILADPTQLEIMAKNCREIIVKKFSEESMVINTEAILLELICA